MSSRYMLQESGAIEPANVPQNDEEVFDQESRTANDLDKHLIAEVMFGKLNYDTYLKLIQLHAQVYIKAIIESGNKMHEEHIFSTKEYQLISLQRILKFSPSIFTYRVDLESREYKRPGADSIKSALSNLHRLFWEEFATDKLEEFATELHKKYRWFEPKNIELENCKKFLNWCEDIDTIEDRERFSKMYKNFRNAAQKIAGVFAPRSNQLVPTTSANSLATKSREATNTASVNTKKVTEIKYLYQKLIQSIEQNNATMATFYRSQLRSIGKII